MSDKSEAVNEASESDALTQKVKSWLADQGYPLEMRVARVFREHQIQVFQSDFYYDKESRANREIDLLARIPLQVEYDWTRVPGFLCPVVECKSSPGKPWILFSGGVNLAWRAKVLQRFVTESAHKHWRRLLFKYSNLPTDLRDALPLFDIEQDPAYSAVRSSLGRSREDAAYGAMMSVSKAAHAVANEYSEPRENLALQIAFPVIVVDSPIFTCRLDEAGEPVLARVESGTIVWRNGFSKGAPPHSIIRVVSEGAIPKLCEEILCTAKTIREALAESPWMPPSEG